MTNGTSGDINNIDFINKRPSRKPYEQMALVGRDVAEKVVRAEKEITYHDWVPLGSRKTELTLKVRKPSAEILARAHTILKQPEDRKVRQRRERIYANRTIAMSKAPETVSVPLHAIRIGEVGIAALPFEVFVEIGLEIKKRTPFERSFTISFGNGSYGYLPTPEQHDRGGYETWLGTNRVEFQASRKMTDRLLEMLNGLSAKN